MAKRQRPPVEKYHDRVSGIYDTIYDGNPYWETVFEITWRQIRRVLPDNLSCRCLDIGCGTGRWGLKLYKSGFSVDFLDISWEMLEQVRKKLDKLATGSRPEPKLLHTSIADMSGVPERYGFIISQGDALNCVERPDLAMREIARCLAPGGIFLSSVDNTLAGVRHYLKDADIDGLEKFLKTGRTHWVTDEKLEQYEIKTLTPAEIRRLCQDRGLELISIIGKTVLPLRRFQSLLVDRSQRERLIRLEESLHKLPEMLGTAAHLEFVAKKPETAV